MVGAMATKKSSTLKGTKSAKPKPRTGYLHVEVTPSDIPLEDLPMLEPKEIERARDKLSGLRLVSDGAASQAEKARQELIDHSIALAVASREWGHVSEVARDAGVSRTQMHRLVETRHPGFMATVAPEKARKWDNSLTAAQAEKEIRAAGYEPLVPWPGPQTLWEVRHSTCGEVWKTTVHQVRKGMKCPCQRGHGWTAEGVANANAERAAQALADVRAAGFEPVDGAEYPGSQKVWQLRCTKPECGKVQTARIGDVRRGRRCTHKRSTEGLAERSAQALADVRAAGFEPVDGAEYPGGKKRWALKCTKPDCGKVRHALIREIRQGYRCTHGETAKVTSDTGATDAG